MTSSGPSGQQAPEQQPAQEQPPPAPTAVERANRMSAANMIRSLAPLVLICLLVVGWIALRQSGTDPVRTVDPGSSVQFAASRAGYELEAPAELPDGYRPTSARTDAGEAAEGAPVTLEIGYLTPSDEYAGFVTTDDPRAEELTAVLDDATEDGTVDLGGRTWTRLTSERGETVLTLEDGEVTTVVTGSADDDELETVAGSVAPVVVR
ncbi:DUF4245 domain-containing protein [Geodermatophilus nigrescens]|uniref:DUF4245 domain-containing protein n=1 Tax=Geodermatophilus nigrescens TaxID=1070870 RepID=A0A1M5EDX1_9ACTN|nr:DUF4245 domain-containing protein [Geodermatophilus nigrescens]SHF77428.1 Protein of unknown function [Geodermatophilus nigrescens]